MQLSVILCSRNPRQHYLQRVIAALREQSIPGTDWELLVVDNGSTTPLRGTLDLSWHPAARVTEEPAPGLTNARLRGIQDSRGNLVVFVDDDNLLDPGYLESCTIIANEFPQLGTWGGEIIGQFESKPVGWRANFLNWLAVRSLVSDLWGNIPFVAKAHPYGAGMCIRRDVCNTYADLVRRDPLRRRLDRIGDSLWGGGDADMNYTANHLGFGNGVFKRLQLSHLIPSSRLTDEYLLRLIEDMTCSSLVVHWLWGQDFPSASRSERLLNWYRRIHLPVEVVRTEKAKHRGRLAARRFIDRLDDEARSFKRPSLV